MKLILYSFRFSIQAIKALIHPENTREWRFAFAYFVFPLFVMVFVCAVSILIAWLLPYPFNWIGLGLWLFYMAAEGFLYLVEWNAYDKWDRWIKTGRK